MMDLTISRLSLHLEIKSKTTLPLIWVHSINGDTGRIRKVLKKIPNGYLHIGYSPLISNFVGDIDREIYHAHDELCVIGPIDNYILRGNRVTRRNMYVAGLSYYRHEWVRGKGNIRRQMISLLETNEWDIGDRRLLIVDKDWGNTAKILSSD